MEHRTANNVEGHRGKRSRAAKKILLAAQFCIPYAAGILAFYVLALAIWVLPHPPSEWWARVVQWHSVIKQARIDAEEWENDPRQVIVDWIGYGCAGRPGDRLRGRERCRISVTFDVVPTKGEVFKADASSCMLVLEAGWKTIKGALVACNSANLPSSARFEIRKYKLVEEYVQVLAQDRSTGACSKVLLLADGDPPWEPVTCP